MNKSVLGLLALTSVVSLASGYEDFHGYIKSSSTLEIEKAQVDYDGHSNVINLENTDDRKLKAKAGLEVGSYFHKNKDLYVFAGVDGLGLKNAVTDWNRTDLIKPSYYLGGRLDLDVVENWNLILTLGHKHNEGLEGKQIYKDDKIVYLEDPAYLENVVRGHLKEKGKDSTQKDLLEEGYVLKEGNYTTLMSAILKGKLNDNLNLVVGSVYNTKDFDKDSHNLITFGKVKGKVKENVAVEANLRHTIDGKDIHQLGGIKGDVKVDTKLGKVDLANKLGFDLKNIKKDGSKHKFEVFTENLMRFNAKNTKLELGADYKLGVELNSSNKFKHSPKVQANLIYDNGMFKASTKNSNEVVVEHNSAIDKVYNNFRTTNNLAYEGEIVGLGLEADYLLKKDFKSNNGGDKHRALFSPEIKAKYMNDEETLDYSMKSSLSYLLGYDTKLNKQDNNKKELNHKLMLEIKNGLNYRLNEATKLKGNLDVYAIAELKTHNKAELKKDGNITSPVIILNPRVEIENKQGRYTNTLSADLKYLHEGEVTNNSGLKYEPSHSLGLEAEVKSSYEALDNVDIVFGIKGYYSYNNYLKNDTKALMKYIEAKGKTKGGYADHMIDFYEELSNKEQADLREEIDKIGEDYYTHNLELKPMLGAKISLLEERVKIEPKLQGIILMSDGEKYEKQANQFLMRKIGAKASLDIKYSW